MRFVILYHEVSSSDSAGESSASVSDGRVTHWDFMLQSPDSESSDSESADSESADGKLLTWALSEQPTIGKSCLATKLPNHRAKYLDYEGPVSQARGHVTQWDAGTYTIVRQSDDGMVVRLQGTKLQATATLRLTAGSADNAGKNEWSFSVDVS